MRTKTHVLLRNGKKKVIYGGKNLTSTDMDICTKINGSLKFLRARKISKLPSGTKKQVLCLYIHQTRT